MSKGNKLENLANGYIKFADVLYKIIQAVSMLIFIINVKNH